MIGALPNPDVGVWVRDGYAIFSALTAAGQGILNQEAPKIGAEPLGPGWHVSQEKANDLFRAIEKTGLIARVARRGIRE